jgi:hypothetical protein
MPLGSVLGDAMNCTDALLAIKLKALKQIRSRKQCLGRSMKQTPKLLLIYSERLVMITTIIRLRTLIPGQ